MDWEIGQRVCRDEGAYTLVVGRVEKLTPTQVVAYFGRNYGGDGTPILERFRRDNGRGIGTSSHLRVPTKDDENQLALQAIQSLLRELDNRMFHRGAGKIVNGVELLAKLKELSESVVTYEQEKARESSSGDSGDRSGGNVGSGSAA